MRGIEIDQVNIVVADVEAAVRFLVELGVEVGDTLPEWTAHHRELPAATAGFDVDLDSSTFARYWGGVARGFTGVVMNLRLAERRSVDETFDRALALGAEARREPVDAFWGARYAVVEGPGPLLVGLMSEPDPTMRRPPPPVADFADG